MSKKDDTFEMLDYAPETSKKKPLLILILIGIGLLVLGGVSVFVFAQSDGNLLTKIYNQVKSAPETDPAVPHAATENDTPVVIPSKPVRIIVYFGIESAAIEPNELAKIEDFYQEIKGVPGTVKIYGYTDNQGRSDVGMRLSEQRAANVAESLQVLRNDSNVTIIVEGFGHDDPIADNSTAAGRQQNRRVEIDFIPQT